VIIFLCCINVCEPKHKILSTHFRVKSNQNIISFLSSLIAVRS
jgi:hypothetical protein